MQDAMELRGMALRTQQSYIDAVVGLAKYYRRPPEGLGAEEVERYLLHLIQERKLSWSTTARYFHLKETPATSDSPLDLLPGLTMETLEPPVTPQERLRRRMQQRRIPRPPAVRPVPQSP